MALTREKHELVSWYKPDTVLIFCSGVCAIKGGVLYCMYALGHVPLLMLGYAARLVFRGEEGDL